jgi:hypothetical protein
LAIAVDNLADAESLTAIDKEEEVRFFKIFFFILYITFIQFVFVIKQPDKQQKSRSNSQSKERDNEYQGDNSEGISVEEELSDEWYVTLLLFFFNLTRFYIFNTVRQ